MSEIMNISAIIRQKNPEMLQILRCDDLISAYRMKTKDVMSFLVNEQSLLSIIRVFQETIDPNILCNISGLFTSTNTSLLKFLTLDKIYTEKILDFLANEVNPYNPRLVTSTVILSSAFNYWPQEMTTIFESSDVILPRLVSHIEKLPVFAFISTNLLKSPEQEAFPWFIYLCIMDEHGPGAIRPFHIRWQRNDYTRINAAQRCKAIELLIQFFKTCPNQYDFMKILTQSIPLFLTDASDETEKKLVFLLGNLLDKNDAIAKSAISVINSSMQATPLLQSAMQYISAKGIKMKSDDLQIMLYRYLHQTNHNNMLSNYLVNIIKNSITDEPELVESLNQIMSCAYKNFSSCSTLLMRGFKYAVFDTLDGLQYDPLSEDFSDRIMKKRDEIANYVYDKSFMQSIKKKSQRLVEPAFDAKVLWGSDCQCFSCSFSTVARLDHLTTHIKSPKGNRSKSPNIKFKGEDIGSPRSSSRDDMEIPKKLENDLRKQRGIKVTKKKRTNSDDAEKSQPNSEPPVRTSITRLIGDNVLMAIKAQAQEEKHEPPKVQISSSSSDDDLVFTLDDNNIFDFQLEQPPRKSDRKEKEVSIRKESSQKERIKVTERKEEKVTEKKEEKEKEREKSVENESSKEKGKETEIEENEKSKSENNENENDANDEITIQKNTSPNSVKVPPAPPIGQNIPHRPNAGSPHSKKRPLEIDTMLDRDPSPPPNLPISNPTLSLCTLSTFEYFLNDVDTKMVQTEVETDDRGVNPVQRYLKLSIEVFDPLGTTKDSMPSLQQRRSETEQLPKTQQSQKTIIISHKMNASMKKQKGIIQVPNSNNNVSQSQANPQIVTQIMPQMQQQMNQMQPMTPPMSMMSQMMMPAEDISEMYPRSPPARNPYFMMYEDPSVNQIPPKLQMKVKYDEKGIVPPKLPMNRKGVWDDSKIERPPRSSAQPPPPIVPVKSQQHTEFPI